MNLLCNVCNCLKVGDHLHWHCITTQKIKYVIMKNKSWNPVNKWKQDMAHTVKIRYQQCLSYLSGKWRTTPMEFHCSVQWQIKISHSRQRQDKYHNKGYTLFTAHRVKQHKKDLLILPSCPAEDIHVPLSDACKNNSTAVQLIRQRPTALSFLACRELVRRELKTN